MVDIVGPQGVQGIQGVKGDQGIQGVGLQGPQGIQGIKGDTGDVGPAGPEGPEGPTGPQGIRGPSGPSGGKDAYEAAVDYGFVGTEQDWLASLTGPEGPAGPAGPAGADGATGPAGPAGPAGADGATGPVGPKGDTGPQGLQGPAGSGPTMGTGAGISIGTSSSTPDGDSIAIGVSSLGGKVGFPLGVGGVAIGRTARAASQLSIAIGYESNANSADYSSALGASTITSHRFSTALGYGSKTRSVGSLNHAIQRLNASNGDAQWGVYGYSIITTSATPTILNDAAWDCNPYANLVCEMTISASVTASSNDVVVWKAFAVFRKGSGASSMVMVAAPDVYKTINPKALPWSFEITTNGTKPVITVTGEAGKSIVWTARIDTVEG